MMMELKSLTEMIATINGCIEEDIALEGESIREVKFDLETLVYDFIMDVLDQNELSEYVESFDIDEGKLVFDINYFKVREEQEAQRKERQLQHDMQLREYFESRGL